MNQTMSVHTGLEKRPGVPSVTEELKLRPQSQRKFGTHSWLNTSGIATDVKGLSISEISYGTSTEEYIATSAPHMKCSDCSHPLKPVVALDIDGTLAEWHDAFIEFLELYLGQEIYCRYNGIGEFSNALNLNKRTYQDAKLAFRSGGFKRWMKPYPELEAFISLLKDLDVEVWITTTRPWMRMDSVDPDTREWLRRNGIAYKGLLFSENKYAELVERVDPRRIIMVLDDDLEQVISATSLGLPAVLRRNYWNRAVDWQGPVCATLPIAIDILNENLNQWRKSYGNG